MNVLINLFDNVRMGLETGQGQPLGLWSYLVLAVLVAVEGPIVTLLGAAAAAGGFLRPERVFVAASIGNLAADSGWYLLGYLGNTRWLKRHGHWFKISPAQIIWFEEAVKKHTIKILFVAKLTLSMALPALIATGMARVSWRRWFGAIFLAECIWTGSLVLGGYYLSESIRTLESGIQMITLGLAALVLLILVWYVKKHAPRFDDELPHDKGQSAPPVVDP